MSSDIDKEWGDTVIKVEHVSKCFEMYAKPRHRLQQLLFGRFHKWYKEFWALKDVSFEVKQGDCVGLIGRNGSGKSTMLQIITGTLRPTSGRVLIKPGLRIAALLELGSGFNPEFTGRENVYLNASILGLTQKETDEKFAEIEAFADIGEFIDQPVKNYSSGMMVRLAFAVQVCLDPDILIVDEALAVGDAAFQNKCLDAMSRLFKSKKRTILFVSHSKEVVQSLCTRSILLNKGQIVAKGDVDSTFLRYSVLQNNTLPDAMLSPVFNEVSAKDRPEIGMPLKIKMNHFEILQKKESVFLEHETFRICLNCTGLEDCSHIRFRMIFASAESPSLKITMTASEPVLAIKRGETRDFIFEYDLGNLVPAFYCCTFTFSEYMLKGKKAFNLDTIPNAYFFQIKTNDDLIEELRWLPSWWGYVRNGDLKIIS